MDTFLFELSTPIRLRVLSLLGAFISTFIIVFRPFYLDNIAFPELLQVSIGSGVIFFLVGYALNSLRVNGYWILSKFPVLAEVAYLTSLTFLVGLLVYGLRLRSVDVELSWTAALQFQYFAFVMAIIPLTLSRLVISLLKMQRDLQTRYELNQSTTRETDEPPINLASPDSEEEFSFPFDKWIAAKAAGNYVELFFNTENRKPTVLVRTTFKLLTEAMQHKASFFHCHRSFVVNLDYVSKLTGSSQNYKLELRGLASSIPVSRNSEKELLQSLKQ